MFTPRRIGLIIHMVLLWLALTFEATGVAKEASIVALATGTAAFMVGLVWPTKKNE